MLHRSRKSSIRWFVILLFVQFVLWGQYKALMKKLTFLSRRLTLRVLSSLWRHSWRMNLTRSFVSISSSVSATKPQSWAPPSQTSRESWVICILAFRHSTQPYANLWKKNTHTYLTDSIITCLSRILDPDWLIWQPSSLISSDNHLFKGIVHTLI